MTTRPDQHEPLDADERELAARLRRAGPLDGPSPALDAKILAAAHAAAASHKPRRHGRLAWLGVPPALVTGMGVAAAAVLALGLVWQLRPQYGQSAGEAAPAAAGDEEVIIFAEPSSSARAPMSNPPPMPGPVASDAAKAARAPARIAEAEAEADSVAAVAAQAQANEERAKVADARMQKAEAQAAQADAEARAPLSGTVAAPASEDAGPQAFSYAEPAQQAAQAPATAANPSPARKNHATYTTAARATAERRERAVAAAPAAPPAPPPPAAAPPVAETTVLDRIEVTGSRINSDEADWSQVPVSADTQLPAAEWLERIRARRDSENLDDAKASLKLFRRDHPRVRIPDDLRALLAADAR